MIFILIVLSILLCFTVSIIWSKRVASSLVTGDTTALLKKSAVLLSVCFLVCILFTWLCYQVVAPADAPIMSLWAVGHCILLETFVLYLFFLKTMQKLKMAPPIKREKRFRVCCAVLSTFVIAGLSCLVRPDLIAICVILLLGVIKITLTIKKNSIYTKLERKD